MKNKKNKKSKGGRNKAGSQHSGRQNNGQQLKSKQHQSQQHQKSAINKQIEGTVKRHPDGYGFFIPDDREIPDVYIPKHSMEGVMANDRVTVLTKRDGDRLRGDIIKIVTREIKQVSGQIKKVNSAQGLLRDESFAWGEDLKVSWPPSIQIEDKDWVVVKITSYPDSVRGFRGEVTSVIGDISDPQNDNIRVLAAQSIPHVFSKAALAEASALLPEVSPQDMEGRKDLRKKNFITIDGKTAKDFDDAIYVEKLGSGFRLWVAIADVSHYVRPGSAIDKDAYERGTSTYFPNFVSPMLPEALSNELCSLKPNVARLSLVAEMDFNFSGEMIGSRFFEAVIQSQARVTYGEAQEVIDGDVPDKLKHVKAEIKLASELSHILMDRRFSQGSLNLELPESVVELDAAGVPTDIVKSERIFAHRLIEELMLAANVAVAKFIGSKGMPSIYRIHEPPKEEALEILDRFLDMFGYSKKTGTSSLQKRITEALQEFQGLPQESVVNNLALRSMKQAKYSPENLGHFGLGFEHYTHFTSPIRRYPDLIIHRLLKAAIGVKGYSRMQFDDLDSAGTMLSACEQRSVKAERLIQSIKKARFMEKHLGEEFEGIISSVTKFGVFVALRKFDVDGLLHVEELEGDNYEFDEENLRLVGRKSGNQYAIGDTVVIQVATADHQTGRIDFVLPKGEKSTHAPQAKSQSHQKRGSSQDDRVDVRQVRVSRHNREDKSSPLHSSRKTNPRKHK